MLGPLFDEGLLQRTDLENEAEAKLYVELAADLDDGEAMTLAIAHQRGFTVATDDRKARRIARERLQHGLVIRTTNVLEIWVQNTKPTPGKISIVLRRIQDRARFQPPNDDPLRNWWLDSLM